MNEEKKARGFAVRLPHGTEVVKADEVAVTQSGVLLFHYRGNLAGMYARGYWQHNAELTPEEADEAFGPEEPKIVAGPGS